jgi:Domain of unknown function (DUF4105)
MVVAVVLKILRRAGLVFLAVLLLAWIFLAISFHATGFPKALLLAVLISAALGLVWFAYRQRWGQVWLGMAGLAIVAAAWFLSLQPRDDRDWAADVRHGVSAEIKGNIATLTNVRHFQWKTESDAQELWETRQVNLNQITSVDLISSVWNNPSIAHTLISFGFADGQNIVFSVEIRKEKGESYSSLGGFFRRFELIIIAADESDIVWLRTDARRESVALYPITLDSPRRRQLFLNFLNRANTLAAQPEWYNTLTTNCTTLPFQLVRGISPDVALDWRVIASGHLQEYLYELGVLRPDLGYDEIKARARLSVHGPLEANTLAYSKAIRAAWVE